MDRRSEPQFIDRMYTILKRIGESCKSCPRRNTTACERCWASEANTVIADMNAPCELGKSIAIQDRSEELEKILNFINVNCGVSVSMIANSFPKMTNNTIRSALKRLLKGKQVVASAGRVSVYFPFGTPSDAIDGITQSFQQQNRRK